MGRDRLRGAPGSSYTALRGQGQERDSVLRPWGATEGLSESEKRAHFLFPIKCLQATARGPDPARHQFCRAFRNTPRSSVYVCLWLPLLPQASGPSSLFPPRLSLYLGTQ